MFLSKFDSSIDLDNGKAAIALFCSQDHGKKEQHAVIAVELRTASGQYELKTLDFYPAARVSEGSYNNHLFERGEDKVRDGQVRVRTSVLSEAKTKEQLFQELHIADGLIRNYRVGEYDAAIAEQLIQNAIGQRPPHSPKFRYSGLELEADDPTLVIRNCITWAREQLTNAGITLSGTAFAKLLESTGETSESAMDLNIPKRHVADTGETSCRIM